MHNHYRYLGLEYYTYEIIHGFRDVGIIGSQLHPENFQRSEVVVLHFVVPAQVGAENSKIAKLFRHVRMIGTQQL